MVSMDGEAHDIMAFIAAAAGATLAAFILLGLITLVERSKR